MKWRGRQGSSNVDDRRGKGTGMKLGVGTVIIVVIGLLLGGDPAQLIQMVEQGGGGQTNHVATAAEDEAAQFVSVVLKDTEDVWDKIFREQLNANYNEPTLVLFTGAVNTGCGKASASTGPFYCPADKSLYIDLSFYDELRNRFGAPGDFAMAYVIAHEVAHHVQSEMGILEKVGRMRSGMSTEESNAISVRVELQADYLSGVWVKHAQAMKNMLEEGDVEEALNAANAIGDDRLQKQAQGYVVPESFTHGTSAQRVRWFKKGLLSGEIRDGDTFGSTSL